MFELSAQWIEQPRAPDTRVMFRGRFTLPQPRDVELRIIGASWFVCWLNGEFLLEGADRFDLEQPEFIQLMKQLSAGDHVLAAMVMDEGVATKRLPAMPPFFAADAGVTITWKC